MKSIYRPSAFSERRYLLIVGEKYRRSSLFFLLFSASDDHKINKVSRKQCNEASILTLSIKAAGRANIVPTLNRRFYTKKRGRKGMKDIFFFSFFAIKINVYLRDIYRIKLKWTDFSTIGICFYKITVCLGVYRSYRRRKIDEKSSST